jgi:hypothetical protein
MGKRVNWANVKTRAAALRAEAPQHTTTAPRGREPTEGELSKLKLSRWKYNQRRLDDIDAWLKEK